MCELEDEPIKSLIPGFGYMVQENKITLAQILFILLSVSSPLRQNAFQKKRQQNGYENKDIFISG